MKILLNLSFVGTAYCGWQSQKNGKSVQEALTKAANELFGVACDVTGCSRTDSGVHANMYCATVSPKSDIEITVPIEKIPRALNTFLPDDISVISASIVDNDFHPRYNAVAKEYIYKIYTRQERDAFLAGRVWFYPKKLDVEKMKLAAAKFIGKHDFSAFMAQGSKITDCERTVFASEITVDGDMLTFRVEADGFLYNMVRIMVGTLVDVGTGRFSPDDVTAIIEGKDRSKAGTTAPAEGLYLNRVKY